MVVRQGVSTHSAVDPRVLFESCPGSFNASCGRLSRLHSHGPEQRYSDRGSQRTVRQTLASCTSRVPEASTHFAVGFRVSSPVDPGSLLTPSCDRRLAHFAAGPCVHLRVRAVPNNDSVKPLGLFLLCTEPRLVLEVQCAQALDITSFGTAYKNVR